MNINEEKSYDFIIIYIVLPNFTYFKISNHFFAQKRKKNDSNAAKLTEKSSAASICPNLSTKNDLRLRFAQNLSAKNDPRLQFAQIYLSDSLHVDAVPVFDFQIVRRLIRFDCFAVKHETYFGLGVQSSLRAILL